MSGVLGRSDFVAANLAEKSSVTVTPIKLWALVGALVVSLQAYAFVRWMSSELFAPTPVGTTPISQSSLFWLNFWQIAMSSCAVVLAAWVIRKSLKERRVPLEALVVLACGTCYWQDGLAGFYRMFIIYNSHLVNMGSWYPFIPGWISPHSQGISEPIFFGLGCYLGCWAMFVFVGAAGLRQIKKRWPTLGFFQLLGIALILGIIFDFTIEFTWVRLGVYAFPHAVRALCLYPGQWNEYPLYESLFGLTMGGTVFLFYHRDDKGQMLTERGLEQFRSPVRRNLIRFLALSGFFNLYFFATYTDPVWYLSFYNDATVSHTPSYILNGMCGKGTAYECPADDVPMALPGAKPIAPYTGRN